MAAPSYTTDLTDVTLAEDTTGWSELTNHTGGGAATQEPDYFIQGSYCVSQSTGVKTGTECGLEFDYGSTITLGSQECFFVWQVFLASNAVDTFANGGLRFGVGSSSGNINFWKTGGSDFGRYPYGGWQNFAVDPTYTADYTEGVPIGYRIFGSLPNLISAVAKGNPHGVDAIRYGRGEIKIEFGDDTNGYGTFAGIAAQNDAQSNRWGLFQEQAGFYLWKGLLSFGNSTNACDFRDSNKIITVDDTPRTYTSFNRIEFYNNNSRVDWTNISFSAANPSQLSRGQLDVVDNSVTINFNGCTFKDMDTFVFKQNNNVQSCIFQGCNLIETGGANLVGSKVQESTVAADASALSWNIAVDPDGYLDNTSFSKGTNAHHAIELGTNCPTTMTLRGITFSGFNASDSQNDSTLYIKATSGTITINLVGCSGNISYKSDGAAVSLVANPVTTKVTVKDLSDGSVIQDARVLLYVTDGTNFPYQDSVSITGSGTTATVTHTAHGLATNDYVIIKGANEDVYNGAYQITVSDADTYTYTTNETIGTSPATGTITSTFAFISGLTDSNGEVSDSRVVSSDQPVAGWVRKSSSSPYYQNQPIAGTVDHANGLNILVQLVRDE